MATKLTDAVVKALPAPASGEKITYDEAVKGFGIRVTAAGARSFVLNYRTRLGRERRYTIGRFPNWKTSPARTEALELRKVIDRGGDPLGDIHAGRKAPTVADLCDRFEAEHLPRLRPSTQTSYRQQIASEIRPVLGALKVAELSFSDVDRLHRTISKRGRRTRANRVTATLSKMLSLAVKWQYRTDNPCELVERNTEHKRHRYLTGPELGRLATALAEFPDVTVANAVRLALLTGARRGELLAARWDDFDLAAGTWTKPGATTKQKTLHRVALSDVAVRLLVAMRRHAPAGDWLFPARGGGHLTAIRESWDAIREAAGIPDVRLHDLRHTFASISASSGASLPLIGAMLGHSSPTTTHRYAHLMDDPQRAAANRVAEAIGGDIVPLPDRRS
jgi:integrase